MAKARKKPAKTAKKPSGGAAAKVSATNQPQAATAAGVFLHTDDAWSLAYFDPNDLHNLERKLFG